jgi:NADPH:quinone reductase-like Zn-dependent oxidoreductase
LGTINRLEFTTDGNKCLQDLSKIGECRRKCFDLMQTGEIRSLVDEKQFHSLESILDAQEYMLSGQAIGKVVVSL